VIVAEVATVTADVVIAKVAVELPSATVTVAGTVADEELELNVTKAPPAGADPVNVTVACELVPPIIAVGAKAIEFNAEVAGVMVRVAVLVALA
jgi:hypothetical protein